MSLIIHQESEDKQASEDINETVCQNLKLGLQHEFGKPET
jgi:hypothetical protein